MTFRIFLAGVLSVVLLSCSDSTATYDAVIDEIKKIQLPIDTLEKFKIDDFSNAASIKKSADTGTVARGDGRGCIWVYKTKDNLLVFIETEDKGHAGEYGVAYSENQQAPVWNHDEWGERWSTDTRINDHWWNISFRLD